MPDHICIVGNRKHLNFTDDVRRRELNEHQELDLALG